MRFMQNIQAAKNKAAIVQSWQLIIRVLPGAATHGHELPSIHKPWDMAQVWHASYPSVCAVWMHGDDCLTYAIPIAQRSKRSKRSETNDQKSKIKDQRWSACQPPSGCKHVVTEVLWRVDVAGGVVVARPDLQVIERVCTCSLRIQA